MNMRPIEDEIGTCQFVIADGKEYLRLHTPRLASLFPGQPYIWYAATADGWLNINDDNELEATFKEIK